MPLTNILIHQVQGRPGEEWPQLLSQTSTELDPVLGAFFIHQSRVLLTVSTNGLVRRWNLGEAPRKKPAWVESLQLGMAVTGRRMTGEIITARLPLKSWLKLRTS